jgi:hypothetical protein
MTLSELDYWRQSETNRKNGIDLMPSLFAYFDPGPGSLLVQAIVGGTAGLIVFVRYLWKSVQSNMWTRKRGNESSQSCTNGGEVKRP